MKILKGTLKETRYAFPSPEHEKPQVIKETLYGEGMFTYMSDDLGLHKISNPDPDNVAVSLHRTSLPPVDIGGGS
jgi:cysteine dioxygenase